MFKLRVKLATSALLLVSLLLSATVAAHGQTTLEWITLAPANEGFSVKLPVKPKEQTHYAPMGGKKYKMRLYTSVDAGDGLRYMVAMQEVPSYWDSSGSGVKLERFMSAFKAVLSTWSGGGTAKVEVLPDRDLDLNGHPGRQYTLSAGQNRGLVRAFDASGRVYALLVLSADEKSSNVMRFFDSFELKEAPAPVPLPVTDPKPS